jgi:hypothetical protein
MQDAAGREQNLDGTYKAPYRHPHYGHQKNPGHMQQLRIEHTAREHQQQGHNITEPHDEDYCGSENRGGFQKTNYQDIRKLQPVVKPAKLNIPEFEGDALGSKPLNNTLMLPGRLWTREHKLLLLI